MRSLWTLRGADFARQKRAHPPAEGATECRRNFQFIPSATLQLAVFGCERKIYVLYYFSDEYGQVFAYLVGFVCSEQLFSKEYILTYLGSRA